MPTYKKFEQCKGCTLYNAPGPVFTEGDPDAAKVIVIGQNPAVIEVQEGRPFCGPTGRVFNRQLFEAGVPRQDLFITNVCKCESPNNRPPTPLEVSKCAWILEKELQRCRADTVILLGQIAFNQTVGSYSTVSKSYNPSTAITERMGCVEVKDGRKWIASVHPSGIMRTPKLWWKAVDVLRKAYNIAGKELPRLDIRIYPSDKEVIQANEEIRAAGEFSDDFETAQSFLVEEDDYVGGDSHPTMLGISWRERQAILIRPEQIHLLEPSLFNPQIWRYEHNGAFDNYYMERVFNGRTPTARPFDTMLAHHYLRSYDYKRLKPDCLGTYTTLPYYGRDLAKLNEPLYCCYDVMATIETAHREMELLKKWKLWDVYFKYGQPIIPILEEWRRIGINTDVRKLLTFRKIIQQKIARAELLISKIVGPSFNPNSRPQLAHLFYEVWKLPEQFNKVKSKDGGFEQRRTTDYEAKKRLKWWIDESPARQEKYKVAKFFLDLTDYLEGEQSKLEVLDRVSPDGRIHAFFKAHGASSFRLASSPNVQNIPKHDVMKWGTSSQHGENPLQEEKVSLGSLRSVVVPDHPDDLLLTVDLEQSQLWFYAKQFNCKKMLEIYEKRQYIYGLIFDKLHQQILKDGRCFFQDGKPWIKENKRKDVTESELKHIKAVPLGFLFGRDAEAVAKEYGLPLEDARQLRKIWFTDFVPELIQAYEWMYYEAHKNGKFVRHRFGNIVWFPTMKRTEIYNSYAQSPEAFLMIGHIIEIDRRLKAEGLDKHRTRMVLSVHDSLTLNVGNAKVDPSRMIHVYENIVAPTFNRPIPEMDNFIFRHSADVSEMWDWNDIAYHQWKLARTGENTSSDQLCAQGVGGKQVPM